MKKSGFTIVELLIAAAVMALLLIGVSLYLAQQSKATTRGQARNDTELSARTVAEAVAQDFQLAGSRAVYIAGVVEYEDVSEECNDQSRSECVVATKVGADGSIGIPTTEDEINGYSIFYRSSLFPAEPCRRVDYAFVADVLYRSDVECEESLPQIDLGVSRFAENVTEWSVVFDCSDGEPYENPAECYAVTDAYVSAASVSVMIELPGRAQAVSEMEYASVTPNLRPSVDYGLPPTEGEDD